ncbi:MAG: ECF-type sigma factor, partial [Acidobacteriota bacterium]
MTQDTSPQDDITRLLLHWRSGNSEALDQLMPLVYEQLKEMAHRQMSREGSITLQATALVHEAYLRFIRLDVEWQDRTHFFALAASMMRRILVDEAKKRRSAKRGGNETFLLMEETDPPRTRPPIADLLDLDLALRRLAEHDPRKAKVIELRFFAGLTIAECVEVDLIRQPGASHLEVPLHGGVGDSQHLDAFGDGQAGKEAQL